jgi:hypothetical protein
MAITAKMSDVIRLYAHVGCQPGKVGLTTQLMLLGCCVKFSLFLCLGGPQSYVRCTSYSSVLSVSGHALVFLEELTAVLSAYYVPTTGYNIDVWCLPSDLLPLKL